MAPNSRPTPRRLFLGSMMWVVVCAFWLSLLFTKLYRQRSAVAHVSPFRHGIIVFWIVLLAFWMVMACKHLGQMRADRARKVV
jgi:hypothetical protein